MAWSTSARRSGLTFGEPRSTSETRDLETPARSATSRMVGRRAGSSPLTGIGDLRGGRWNDLPNELSVFADPEAGSERKSASDLDISRMMGDSLPVWNDLTNSNLVQNG